MKTFYEKYQGWIIAVVAIIGIVVIILQVRGCAKEQLADEQKEIDSMTNQGKYLDQDVAIKQKQVDTLKAGQVKLTASLQTISNQRKTESHAYDQNISAVKSLPPDEQFRYLSAWLSAEAAARR